MMNVIRTIVMFFLVINFLVAQQTSHSLATVENNSSKDISETYSLVEIKSTSGIAKILQRLDCDHFTSDNGAISIALSNSDLEILDKEKIEYRILIPDLTRFYSERAEKDFEIMRKNPNLFSSKDVKNFSLGSVGGFMNLQELENSLRKMISLYSSLVSPLQSIGISQQSRPLWAVRISAKPEYDKSVPRVLMTAMHHAREPLGMMSLVYTMWWLLENYGKDFEATYILNNYSIYFLPMINPDGYQKNITDAPNGGGNWRRNVVSGNRLINSVDLNRNYGTQEYWDSPVGGSSETPGNDTYRGVAPFSEPETKAVRDYCLGKKFKIILNYHSYSNVLIEPFDWEYKFPEEDTNYYNIVSPILAGTLGYAVGGANITAGYTARGVADDWMYSFANGNGKTITWTPEAGSADDGFWASPIRIEPLCRTHNNLNTKFIMLAGAYPTVVEKNILFENDEKYLILKVMNIGREQMHSEAEIYIKDLPNVLRIPDLEPLQSYNLKIKLPNKPDDNFSPNTNFKLSINYNNYNFNHEFTLTTEPFETLFYDNFETDLRNWYLADWDLETVNGRGQVVSDSPYKKYTESSTRNILEMRQAVSLQDMIAAELRFDANYQVQAREHIGILQIKTNLDSTWKNLECEELQISTIDTTNKRFYFLGTSHNWRNYRVDLSKYAGQKVFIRFFLLTPRSIYGNVFNGILLDNFAILGVKDKVKSVAQGSLNNDFNKIVIVPQPINDVLNILQTPANKTLQVSITNAISQEVFKNIYSNVGQIKIGTSFLQSGIYWLKINDGQNLFAKKIIIER